MNNRTLAICVSAASTLLFSSALIAQGPPSATTGGPSIRTNESAGSLSKADISFMENAAQAGHAEIEGSKLALEKSTSAAVKSFAQHMIDDHTKVGQELAKLASLKGYQAPTEPSVMQRTELKALSLLKGESFDKMYASRIGVAAHKDAVKLFQTAAQEAGSSDVRAFASSHVQALEQHLKMAEKLREGLGAD